MIGPEQSDLSPIILGGVQWRGREFRFSRTLSFDLSLDDSQQWYIAENAELQLMVYAPTRDELLQEIAVEIAFKVDFYVKAPDNDLAPDALRLKTRLASIVSEVEGQP